MVAGDVQGGVVGRGEAEHGLGVFDHRVDVGEAYQADADIFAACGVGLAVAAVEGDCPFEQFGGEGCGVGAVDVEPFGAAADGLGGEFCAAVAAKGFVLPDEFFPAVCADMLVEFVEPGADDGFLRQALVFVPDSAAVAVGVAQADDHVGGEGGGGEQDAAAEQSGPVNQPREGGQVFGGEVVGFVEH